MPTEEGLYYHQGQKTTQGNGKNSAENLAECVSLSDDVLKKEALMSCLPQVKARSGVGEAAGVQSVLSVRVVLPPGAGGGGRSAGRCGG